MSYESICKKCEATITVSAVHADNSETNQSHNDHSNGPICQDFGMWESYRSNKYESSRVPEEILVHCPLCWTLNVISIENNLDEYSGCARV